MKRNLVMLAVLLATVFGLIKFVFIIEARSSASAAASILPAQTQSTFSINDVSVTEGDSGTVNAVEYSTYLGGSGIDSAFGVAVDIPPTPEISGGKADLTTFTCPDLCT